MTVTPDDRPLDINWRELSGQEALALTLFRRKWAGSKSLDTVDIGMRMNITEAEASRLLHSAREKGRMR